ncbi:MAG: hypothetical protein AMJ88_13645 [Anaerolineae bacterium SM23_ 63]|nr:MAG: hypothetical protein AMJ88_13645 [Anaerolineae bacterium SM23_ 63]
MEKARTISLDTVSWKDSLAYHTTLDCECEKVDPKPYSMSDGRLMIRCGSCSSPVGLIPVYEAKLLHRMSTITIEYREATDYLTRLLEKNPTWRMMMTKEQPESIHSIDSDRVIRLLPGHMVFESKAGREGGETCNHRLVLEADERSARCVLCGGTRTLADEEIKAIDAAQQAGVIFLKWEERLKAMENLRTRRSKKRRRTPSKKGTVGPSEAVETKDAVPEGFVPVAEAAKKIGVDAKTLRKQVRSKVYEGVKVGGRVYVRIRK